ncbi:MAG: hypothetical protein OXF01_17845 [Gemmatimonadetes bacterium]|nr:hypothetical protein [Gemmatimonadota bacterium]
MADQSFDNSPALKTAVDLEIVGENILDIADFAVEKYEFRHDTRLSPEAKQEAAEQVRAALWEVVEAFKIRRRQVLQRMFDTADKVVQESVEGS